MKGVVSQAAHNLQAVHLGVLPGANVHAALWLLTVGIVTPATINQHLTDVFFQPVATIVGIEP